MKYFKLKSSLSNPFSNSKKGIGPVIATTLLIVLVVLSVLLFQNWFSGYQSTINTKIESHDSYSLTTGIETIVGDKIYIKSGVNNLTVQKIQIDGIDCSFSSGPLTTGVQSIDLSGCLNFISSKTPEVVIITNQGIMSKYVFLRNLDLLVKDLEEENLFIGNECKFKDNKTNCEIYYESKNIDGIEVIHDTILGLYWERSHSIDMTWTDAQILCSNKGDGWRLPTSVEFETSLIDMGRENSPYIIGGNDAGNLFNIIGDMYWTYTKTMENMVRLIYLEEGIILTGFITANRPAFCVKEDDNYENIWQNTQKFIYEDGMGQKRIAEEFIIDSSNCDDLETIYDSLTNLCWERSPSTNTMNFIDAQILCSNKGDGWRLPERAEITTLLDTRKDQTYIELNSIGFNNIENGIYWTNTKYSDTRTFAAYFSSGSSTYIFAGYSGVYSLCVKDSN